MERFKKIVGDGNGVLKCDLKYFKNKLSYIEMVAAQIYEYQRKGYLTEREREELTVLEEDLNLHLRDLRDKCGVTLTEEQVINMFKEHPNYLEELSFSLLNLSNSGNGKEERNNGENK